MKEAKILIVDDERAIADMMATVLRKEGFSRIDLAHDGEEALAACARTRYDLVLLDVMMPGRSGLEICPFIRGTTDAPIFFLTARSSDFDKLSGFAVGGDDYITKPFNPLEVVARIQAQLRRYLQPKQQLALAEETAQGMSGRYDFGRFQVDEAQATLTVEGQPSHCPALVFQLLLFLCKHPNRVFSKSELYERVWGEEAFADDNTVMVHVHRIRERIERNPSKPEYLVNVRGLGYKLMLPEGER
ncbi:DNA-binding response OmpR family regulator [Paenibacillus phyllosphaerae]|uniref:DNA-binding response OmpR family regulator n=1 Tax=Paenibacillus phyllosphaerae TaxID=274593 RepID=A0A7W5FNQ3_9BACL|nr:response regulator transcription factor [Paenibacillus phyllosphaerae]MBB3111372.1 DNA-binding response OmpR family regulator [Paenibacillus phyllosphaerae]